MTIKSLLVLLCFSSAFAQVCQKSIWRIREEPQTFQYTYYEAYEDSSCWFWCTKSRLATNIDVRFVKKYYTEINDECCDGYVPDEENKLNCIPKCGDLPCQNGFCNAFNECTCNPGYFLDPDDNTKCLPVNSSLDCPTVIQNCEVEIIKLISGNESNVNVTEGICSENITEKCCFKTDVDENSSKNSKSNEDTSKSDERLDFNPFNDMSGCGECKNGECVGDICVCNPGWYLNSNGSCLPHCEACINGICKEPNICECNDGFHFDVNSTPQCIPYCNSTKECIFQNVCSKKQNVECEKCKETCKNDTKIDDEVKLEDPVAAHLVRIKVFHDKHKTTGHDHVDSNVKESLDKEIDISEIHV